MIYRMKFSRLMEWTVMAAFNKQRNGHSFTPQSVIQYISDFVKGDFKRNHVESAGKKIQLG